MKYSNNTIPIVFLELVAGILFLVLVLVATSLIETRISRMSQSSQSALAQARLDIEINQKIKAEREQTLLALSALEKRVDSLLNNKNALPAHQSVPTQQQIESILAEHLQQLAPRFETLHKKLGAIQSNREEALIAKVIALDEKINSLMLDRKRAITPTLSALNKKADQLFLEQDSFVAPILKMLNSKMDLLLQDEDHRLVVGVTPKEGSGSFNTDLDSAYFPYPVSTLGQTADNPSTDNTPVVTSRTHKALLKKLDEKMEENRLQAVINLNRGGIQLPKQFDFQHRSSLLSPGQLDYVAKAADALAEILPCYARTTTFVSSLDCSHNPAGKTLQAINIVGYSTGENVGSARFNYNWQLATARSTQLLKALVTLRPDLLEFRDKSGNSLFKAIAELIKVGDSRSRRVELQFIFSEENE
ncbi:MAG: hypothetical protein HQL67_06710 [Magnetococcales bacterium]|nr:hypothetical protein [Magnetococcales bacterium]